MFKKKIKIKPENSENKSLGGLLSNEAKQKTEQISKTLRVEDLPINAIHLAYEELMKKYQDESDNEIKTDLQMKLVILSKILTSSLSYGNGEVMQYFINKGRITQERWEKMTEEDRNHLTELYQKLVDIDREVNNISKEKIEFTIPVETPVTLNQDKSKTDTHITLENDSTLSQIISESISPVEDEKKKGKFGSFFKKKVPVESVSESIKEESEVKHLLKEESDDDKIKKERIKNRARELEEATLSKFKTFGRKKETEDKPHLDLKSFENIYCLACKHSLKSHQSKGVSKGCACGCLATIEDIALSHKIPLYKPKEILKKIEEENSVPVNEMVEPEEEPPISTIELLKDDLPQEIPTELIEKQAKALKTMITKSKPDQVNFQTSSSTQKIPMQESKPIEERSNKPKASLCANCDHIPSTHFDDPANSFCTVIGCTCSEFRAYPS